MNIETLFVEHDSLNALLDAALKCANAGDADAFLSLRMDIAEALARYLALEAKAIEQTRRRPLPSETAAAVADLAEQTAALVTLWQEYLEEWDREAIQSDRVCFQSSTAALIQRLRKRSRQAVDLLCPAAVRTGALRLRVA